MAIAAASRIMQLSENTQRAVRRQTCKVCGRPDKFDFHVPDPVWKKVVPPAYRNKVVCLACFDRFAFDKQIDYSEALEILYFAGDRASFKFQTVSAGAV